MEEIKENAEHAQEEAEDDLFGDEEIEEKVEPETIERTMRKREKKKKEKEALKRESVGALKRQIKEQEEIIEEEKRLENYNDNQKLAYQVIKKTTQKKGGKKDGGEGGIDLDEDQEVQQRAKQLIDRMQDAITRDRENNKIGKPALNRLMMLDEVLQTLKIFPVQQIFLEEDGCSVLSEWLDVMPDNTFPNINLVEALLSCINDLHLDMGQLEGRRLGVVIQYYADGTAKMPKVRRVAKQILDKWHRQIYNINQCYDAQGNYDEGYRELQKRIDQVKQRTSRGQDQDDEQYDRGTSNHSSSGGRNRSKGEKEDTKNAI